MMSHIPYSWTKEKEQKGGAASSCTNTLLASAYAGLKPEQLEEEEMEEGLDRYACWRKEYETLFDHAKASAFPPMDDDTISSDTPWRMEVHTHRVVDPSPKVDLRLSPFIPLTGGWEKPKTKSYGTLMHKRDSEDGQDEQELDDPVFW
jgi:hypothetical protein